VKLSLDGFWWLVVLPVLSVLAVLGELTQELVSMEWLGFGWKKVLYHPLLALLVDS
jgi:hypothetical protein